MRSVACPTFARLYGGRSRSIARWEVIVEDVRARRVHRVRFRPAHDEDEPHQGGALPQPA